MKITVLTENVCDTDELIAEHGLSFFIETQNHKILFDMGQSDAFARNAESLGIDLSSVDMAVLSHGHYDHGGGIAKFLEINKKASIYVSNLAFGAHYNGREEYIGLDLSLKNSKRLIMVDKYLNLDEELSLFSCNERERSYPTDNYGLEIDREGILQADDFLHEQYLLIKENGKRVLFSGCSHKGILNITEWFEPDVLIGGFHFMKLDSSTKDADVLSAAADELLSYDAKYYTCHCTGIEQFEFLKRIMGDKLSYLSTGMKLEI